MTDSHQACDITPQLHNAIIYSLTVCAIQWTIHRKPQKLKGGVSDPPDLLIFIFWKGWKFSALSTAGPF